MYIRIRAEHFEAKNLIIVTLEMPSFDGPTDHRRWFAYGDGDQYPTALAATMAAEDYANGAIDAARLMSRGYVDNGGTNFLTLRLSAKAVDKAAEEQKARQSVEALGEIAADDLAARST